MRASSALRSRIRLCRSDVVVLTAFCAASTELAIERAHLLGELAVVVAQLALGVAQHVAGVLADLERHLVDVAAHRLLRLGLPPLQHPLALVAHGLRAEQQARRRSRSG